MLRWMAAALLAVPGLVDGTAAAQMAAPDRATSDRIFITRQRGDWVYGCDPSNRCTMVGHANLADPNHITGNRTRTMAIRIEMGPVGARAMTMELIPDRGPANGVVDGIDWSGRFTLSTRTTQGAEIAVPFARHTPSAAEQRAIILAMQQGRVLRATNPLGGNAEIIFPAVGFSDVYEAVRTRQTWVADWQTQHRDFTRPRAVYRGLPAIVSGYPAVNATMMDWCGSGEDANDLQQFTLQRGAALWAHHCPVDDGMNRLSRWYVVPEASRDVQPAVLPDAGGATSLMHGRYLPNASYDFDLGVLRSYRYDSPAHDCGVMMVWGWTGGDFLLIERREMPVCQGLSSTDWIRTYWRPVAVSDWVPD